MDIFARFKSAIKIRDVHIHNNVFQLHYRVTALLLLGCAALVASKQHFGDPIDCITRDEVPTGIMDTYCWIHATFTLPDACNRTVGSEVAHPCVDKFDSGKEEDRVYHKYYQWVYFVLLFQALCFYLPHLCWKSCESSLLKTLCSGLKDPLFRDDERLNHASQVVTYLYRRRTCHQKYHNQFTMFEIANFVNVVAQIYIINSFLGGTFTNYGFEVLDYIMNDEDGRVDPMVRVFPRMTKCTFHRFGASGDVQRHDALCILPLNIINEKIYIVIWFWFIFLACITGLWLLYRLATYTQPELRFRLLCRDANFVAPKQLRVVLKDAPAGDWFLLKMMCKNVDSRWFGWILDELAHKLWQERRGRIGRSRATRRDLGREKLEMSF